MAGRRLAATVVVGMAFGVVAVGPADAARLITGKQIKNNSIKSEDIKNRSIKPADLSSSAVTELSGEQGERGPQGAPGPQGPQGAPGAPGAPGTTSTFTVVGPKMPLGPASSGASSVNSSKAECPPGSGVVAGGHTGGIRVIIADAIASGNGWFVIGVNAGSSNASIQAQATCVRGAAAPGPNDRPAVPERAATKSSEMAAVEQARAELARQQR